MNKKMWFIAVLLLSIFSSTQKVYAMDLTSEMINEQKNNFGISEFLDESNKYTGEFFDSTDIGELLNSAIKGKIDNSTILKKVLNIFAKESLSTIKTMAGIIVIILIHSIIKAVADNLETSNISTIIYYAQYILIVTLVMNNFLTILSSINNTINNLVGFMHTLVPLLMALMIYTGSITTSGLLEPIILFLIEFIGNIIASLIIPLISIITALAIISKISDRVSIGKLTSFMKSSIVWFLGIILTVFVGVVSLEGTLTSSVDGITAKTAKAAVSSVIPVVGKILGDSVDSILGCGLVLKNALGIVGVIIIIGICILPIIKVGVLSMMYSITSAVVEPLADTKIVKLLEEFGSIFKLLFAILCSVSVLLIIGITLVVKISNSGMMYR